MEMTHPDPVFEEFEDFDWQSLDDPVGRIMEDMSSVHLTRPQAEAVHRWATRIGVSSPQHIMERIGLWLVGTYKDDDAQIARRARVYAGLYAPSGRHALSKSGMGIAHGVDRSEIGRLRRSLRKSVFRGGHVTRSFKRA